MNRIINKNNTLYKVSFNLNNYMLKYDYNYYQIIRNADQNLNNVRKQEIFSLFVNAVGFMIVAIIVAIAFVITPIEVDNFLSVLLVLVIIACICAMFPLLMATVMKIHDVFFKKIENSVLFEGDYKDYEYGTLITNDKLRKNGLLKVVDDSNKTIVQDCFNKMSDDEVVDFVEMSFEFQRLSKLNEELLESFKNIDSDSIFYKDAKKKQEELSYRLRKLKYDLDNIYESSFPKIVNNDEIAIRASKNKKNDEKILSVLSKIDELAG